MGENIFSLLVFLHPSFFFVSKYLQLVYIYGLDITNLQIYQIYAV